MKKVNFILFLVLFCFSISVFSEDILEKFRINGFLSQGYIKTTKNNFLPKSKANGSLEITEFGFTLNTDLSDKLRVGFQLLSRDYGDVGNFNIVLDWTFADYHFSDLFGIRVGKIKTPIGLYNEGRDTDTLRPMAMLPQGIYDDHKRDIAVAYNGLGFYGDIPLGFIGDFEYHMFYGTVSHNSDAIYMRYITNIANSLYPATGILFPKLEMTTDSFYGGRVIWNTPIDGFRIGGTYLNYEATIEGLNNSSDIGSWQHKNWFVLSTELVIGNLTLASEFSEMPIDIKLLNFPILTNQATQSWYVQASMIFGEKLTISGLYEEYYANKNDKKGSYFVQRGMPDFLGWRKDIGAGIRYDINFNWSFKIEWHRIDGAALFLSVYNNISEIEKKWDIFIIKSSFNF